MRILVVSRGYPSPERLYNYSYVHRRVLAYRAMGHDVCVVFLVRRGDARTYVWDGITVHVGDADACVAWATDFAPDAVAAQSFADDFWPALSRLPASLPIYAWIQGAEMLGFHRTTQRPDDPERMAKATATFDRRIAFFNRLARDWPANVTLVFPSRYAAADGLGNLDRAVPDASWTILPNPIDTHLFVAKPKPDAQRFDILSIRPFSDWRYANDLSVAAVLAMREHPLFDRFRFRFVGEGYLMDRILAPIADLPHVSIDQRFLRQEEIANMHKASGVFLVPTRDDAQGVSRDEAMASGLVPVTNRVGAIPEFVDDACAGIAEPEDAVGLANAMLAMAENAALFQARSLAAARRIRATLAIDTICQREIDLMAGQ